MTKWEYGLYIVIVVNQIDQSEQSKAHRENIRREKLLVKLRNKKKKNDEWKYHLYL